VDYTGTLTDGTMFDSSVGREPLEFTVGSGQMIAGFDQAIVGMEIGTTKKIQIPCVQAYGDRQEDLVIEVQRNQLPAELNPKVGDRLGMRQPNGRVVEVAVTTLTDSSMIIDANHFLAGKDLIFEITILEIKR
jgi:FKBP-type peptidyl-prolyl cis-trans isomerase 2